MERANFKRYFAHIRFGKRRLGNVSSSPGDLLCRHINADDSVPKCNKITRDWNACTTTEIETRPRPAAGKPLMRRPIHF